MRLETKAAAKSEEKDKYLSCHKHHLYIHDKLNRTSSILHW